MSFIDGSEEKSINQAFKIIPDNTVAAAVIYSVNEKQFGDITQEPWFYQVEWKILEGKHKNRLVRQNIKINHVDEEQRAVALNMLCRLYVLQNMSCNLQGLEQMPTQAQMPTEQEIATLSGKIYDINIRVYKGKEKETNWVSAVYKYGDKTQDYVAMDKAVKSLYSDSETQKKDFDFNDDIPM